MNLLLVIRRNKWSRPKLEGLLEIRNLISNINDEYVTRIALYRPFAKQYVYYDSKIKWIDIRTEPFETLS